MKMRVLLWLSPLAFLAIWLLTPDEAAFKQARTWQKMVEPGSLSLAHAEFADRCSACHTPLRGVEASACIVCHANDESVLRRQPTSFHADISSCVECHLEHEGIDAIPTKMDHEALVSIGIRQLGSEAEDSEDQAVRQTVSLRIEHFSPPHARITATEATLDCASCHANDDRHFKLFGQDCSLCHATDRWTIPEFRHPSPRSMDCSQCHQAPPSHYMMHFSMISARVAGKPHARLDQCYQCHQTTSWNDILGAGWYKHH